MTIIIQINEKLTFYISQIFFFSMLHILYFLLTKIKASELSLMKMLVYNNGIEVTKHLKYQITKTVIFKFLSLIYPKSHQSIKHKL